MAKKEVVGSKKVLLNQMKEISAKYKLTPDDIFVKETRGGENMYIIINRAGIDKLEMHITNPDRDPEDGEPVMVVWDVLQLAETHCYLKFAIYEGGRQVVCTTGEGSLENVDGKGKYILAMAEKRGRSRAVLKYLGLYDTVKGEDESPEFEKDAKGGSNARTTIKG
jgi:hypothetical protein